MKIFVTGVGGQLGHDVVNELCARGHEVFGSELNDTPFWAGRSTHREILAIHNHPEGLPPSLDDGVSALIHGYSKGVVVGHNLEVFSYGRTNKYISPQKCAEIHKALSDTLQFELDFDDNEWYDVLKSFGMEVERK